MQKKNRPLSPHLAIYKPEITSVVSIFHRISGSLLAIIIILFTFIIYLDSIYSEYYILYYITINFLYTYLFFISLNNFFLLIISFHFCNGLRHICWDFCFGLDIKNVYITGLFILFITNIILFILLL
jgi:succinate dehydrogenase / fumarate reductase cytochrome b subunit